MVAFQRSRSEEQREARRRAILDAAAAMLDEMPPALREAVAVIISGALARLQYGVNPNRFGIIRVWQ